MVDTLSPKAPVGPVITRASMQTPVGRLTPGPGVTSNGGLYDVIASQLASDPYALNISPRRRLSASLTQAVGAGLTFTFVFGPDLSDTLSQTDALYIESWSGRIAGNTAAQSFTVAGFQASLDCSTVTGTYLDVGQISATTQSVKLDAAGSGVISFAVAPALPLITFSDIQSMAALQSLTLAQPLRFRLLVNVTSGATGGNVIMSTQVLYRKVAGLLE